MRAVRYAAYGATPELVDLPAPDCPSDGVLVRVEATGVCRSDWHAWRGHDPVPLPMVPGHELAGVVAEVGAGVAGWSVGDRVTVPFVVGCGRCAWCRAGEQQVCPDQQQPGFTYAGSWAELVAVPAAAANLVRLPDGVDTVTAATLGCRYATAFRALRVHGQVAAGQWVAVHGCGGVGLSAVQVARALGAHVVAIDPSADARRLAVELGAHVVVDPAETDAAAYVQDVAGGADVSLDCVGAAVTARASVAGLRPRGRHVQVGLLLGDAARDAIPMDLVVARELSVHGSHGMPSGGYAELLDLVADGTLDPRRLVTRVVDLAEGPAALAALDDPSAAVGITVLRP
ncbi:alcohol dehydrogenase catalytic domain-containing protein [Nocardioides aurantiacus]|uniref:Alcohol dehydrogenase n=1 Tax=Nocardioides aurantiacus TaxID=86796 RepID=A0A3N2D010_9ACTN|nr:alcohol dehydrogenase catalytic domain-containing protein [Nocardioides aurantiacus]ROR92998.1 alcohol dehydrogenase [Nocardioides aurantiacus]